jgi:hypothetical protein
MGFKAASARGESPRMVLIAAVGDKDGANAAKERADAVLYSDFAVADKLASNKDKLPWGVVINEANDDQMAKLKKKGCDFFVFDAASASLAPLRDESVGRMVELPPELPDGLVRTTAQLPVDMALVGGDAAVSVQRLMLCQHMCNMVPRPLMARVPVDISADDLRELWETGLSGVVAEVGGGDGKRLDAIKKAIDGLPATRRRKGGKVEAAVPFIPGAEPEYIEIEEDE